MNGGPIIDITRAPYYAKGSGDPPNADHNTKAFIAFYDFIMRVRTIGKGKRTQSRGRPLHAQGPRLDAGQVVRGR